MVEATPSPAAATPPPAQTADAPARQVRWREWALRLAVLATAGVIVWLFATQWDRWVGGNIRQVTDDAYVRGDITPLSAKVEGYVRKVAVDDFGRVKAGDVLVEIEDDDYRAQVAQAEADLLNADAAIANLKARKSAQHAAVAEAQSAIIATQADVDRTRAEAVRQQALLATTFGTRQKVEQANADEKRLVATLASKQAELDAQQRQMAVLDTQELQARAEYKAKQAELRVDTFPGIVISAHVDSIAPASGSQFSLLPPDNATGNFTKVVQRIPVKLRPDPDNPLKGHLRPGMSVVATILTDTTPPPP
jgi:membrane fusion protein (multidrug efflux system)